MKEIKSEERCPSCGRFAGAYERCPHCGANITKRISLKFFRYFSIFVALAGLLFLYLMATNQEVKVVKAEDITETMNFAYVSVEGKVTSDPRIYEKDGVPTSVNMWIDDGTGDIRVLAYRHVAKEVSESETLPRRGDHLKASGTLRVQPEGNISLIIQSETSLKVTPSPVERMEISRIGPDLAGENVMVEGVVSSLSFPPEGTNFPFRMTLAQGEASIQVIAWRDAYEKLDGMEDLDLGALVEVRGNVGEFRGNPQIHLSRADDLTVRERGEGEFLALSSTGPAKVLKPSDITMEMLGKRTTVEGVIKGKWKFSKGVKFPLEGGGRTIDLLFWNDTWEEVEIKDDLKKGASVRCTGVVKEYKGKLQIQPKSGSDITLLKPAPPATGKKVGISEITRSLLKKSVEVKGKVTKRSEFSKGVKLQLEDGTGSIEIVLWNNVYSKMKGGARIGYGTELEVTGTVKEYRGKLQIHPRSHSDVKVLATVETIDLSAPEGGMEISSASMGGELIGKRVVITGEVTGIKTYKSGTRIDFKDKDGSFQSFIRKKVFGEIEGREMIGEGALLKVCGKVEEYKGKLQVNPISGGDVKVIKEGGAKKVTFAPDKLAIGEVTSPLQGSFVQVTGEIVMVKPIKGGKLYTLKDDTGEVILLVWDSMASKIEEKDKLAAGQKVTVKGEVVVYKGTVEIKLKSPRDILFIGNRRDF